MVAILRLVGGGTLPRYMLIRYSDLSPESGQGLVALALLLSLSQLTLKEKLGLPFFSFYYEIFGILAP